MRLNWFLPPRKASTNGHAKVPAGPAPTAHHAAATATQLAAPPAKLGAGRRVLKALGPTWLASPIRRLIQVTCFALFLAMFFYVLRPIGTGAGPDALSARQLHGAELFLILDPLVSISTAIAAKTWIWSLPAAIVILAIGLLLPRSFCGYICPMGTLIDACDWGVNNRIRRFRLHRRGWWVNLKYYVLTGVVLASLFGVLVAGFFSAVPVITRGMAFLLAPLQLGLTSGWHTVPPMHAGHCVSIALFLLVLGLGLLAPRFWCRYVCPTGALFSLTSLLRLSQRNVQATCGRCGQCKRICPFDAVRDDFTTRPADCAFCQTCGGVCPKGAIQFAPRASRLDLLPPSPASTADGALSRRGFIVAAAASGAVVIGTRRTALGARLARPGAFLPVRPPGSVPEAAFLQMCIRCQECTKACPTGLLQPLRFEQGLEGLWSVYANTNAAGCDPACNQCGEACPTKAIRALPLEEKKAARMGRSVVDEGICLPHAGREACQWCYEACQRAGHDAIEFVTVHVELEDDGTPIAGTGLTAPVVLADKCVGCGLCQSRCHAMNVGEKALLPQAAIHVEAGPGKEDRLAEGSYIALREQERRSRRATPTIQAPGIGASPAEEASTSQPAVSDVELPDFMK